MQNPAKRHNHSTSKLIPPSHYRNFSQLRHATRPNSDTTEPIQARAPKLAERPTWLERRATASSNLQNTTTVGIDDEHEHKRARRRRRRRLRHLQSSLPTPLSTLSPFAFDARLLPLYLPKKEN